MKTPTELVKTLQDLGWSQADIADAIDVSQPTICRIAKGVVSLPHYATYEKLRVLVENTEALSSVKEE